MLNLVLELLTNVLSNHYKNPITQKLLSLFIDKETKAHNMTERDFFKIQKCFY